MSETAWLVEASWQPPHYIKVQTAARGKIVTLEWTERSDEALRFSRREDAQGFLGLLFSGERYRPMISGPGPSPRPVEHMWVDTHNAEPRTLSQKAKSK